MNATTLSLPETLEGTSQGDFLTILEEITKAFQQEQLVLSYEDLVKQEKDLEALYQQVQEQAPTNLAEANSRSQENKPGISWRGGFNGSALTSLCYHHGDPQYSEVSVRLLRQDNNAKWECGRTQITDKREQLTEDGTKLTFLRCQSKETPQTPDVIEYWFDKSHGGDATRGFVHLILTEGGYRPSSIEYSSYGPTKPYEFLDHKGIKADGEDEFIDEVTRRLCPVMPVSTN